MSEDARYIHDAYMSMAERTIRRLWILCILIFICLVISNTLWIYHESQYDTIEQEVSQESELGSNSFIGGDSYSEASN